MSAGARGRRILDDDAHENHERWLITYADMITLLLALFMMLYAMSQLDLQKFQSFQEAFKKGNGKNVHALPGKGDPTDGKLDAQQPGDPTIATNADSSHAVGTPGGHVPPVDRQYLDKLRKQLSEQFSKAGLTSQIQLSMDSRGLVISVHDAALFDSGRADIRPEGVTVLRRLAPALAGISNSMVIQGHTDNVPITGGGPYPSNWELSTARSTAVLRWLLDNYHLQPSRLSAAGYADTQPRVRNDTDAHRSMNRRVEIVVESPQ